MTRRGPYDPRAAFPRHPADLLLFDIVSSSSSSELFIKKKKKRIDWGIATHQDEVEEDLFADGFVAVNVADVLDLGLAGDVPIRRRRDGQNPQLPAYRIEERVIYIGAGQVLSKDLASGGS